MEFERTPVWWDFTDRNQGSSWNVYIHGDLLEGDFLDRPDYDEISLLVTTGEADYPEKSWCFDQFPSRQYVESRLLEEGDLQSFDAVAEALQKPQATDLWEEVSDGRVPLKTKFYYGGSPFRIDKVRSREDIDTPVYPVPDYFDRRGRPASGKQASGRALRENLRDEDREAVATLVRELKDSGATAYIAGSVLETSEYSDIDIAIDGLHWPRESFINRTRGGPYPQRGDEYSGLSHRMEFDEGDLERTLKGIDGLEPGEPWKPDNEMSHGYNAVGLLYTFSFLGTDFDIGYDEEPFVDNAARTDPLDIGSGTRFVKV